MTQTARRSTPDRRDGETWYESTERRVAERRATTDREVAGIHAEFAEFHAQGTAGADALMVEFFAHRAAWRAARGE